MPIYEYKCQKCGHQFETMQGINDDPLKKCPKATGKKKKSACKGELAKLISQTSFSLKGGGWAKDGYEG